MRAEHTHAQPLTSLSRSASATAETEERERERELRVAVGRVRRGREGGVLEERGGTPAAGCRTTRAAFLGAPTGQASD